MATEMEATRLLCYEAAFAKDKGRDYSKLSAMAKLYSSKVGMEVTSEDIQIHGGYGIREGIPRRTYDAGCKNYTNLRGHFRNSKNSYIEKHFKIIV